MANTYTLVPVLMVCLVVIAVEKKGVFSVTKTKLLLSMFVKKIVHV